MQYVKLVNGQLVYAGAVLYTETQQVFNPTQELWLANGWKILVQDDCTDPDLDPVFEEDEIHIYVHWALLT